MIIRDKIYLIMILLVLMITKIDGIGILYLICIFYRLGNPKLNKIYIKSIT